MTAAVVLAGGRSSRMGGGDKPLQELAPGVTILRATLDRLSRQADRVAINANGDPARFADFGLPLLADSVPDLPGPLAGILAALEWAQAIGMPDVLTVAGDTPFLPSDLVSRLSAEAGVGRIAVASSAGRPHPVFAVWPMSLAAALRHHLESGGTGRVMAVIEARSHVFVDFPFAAMGDGPVDPFFNVNTPDDLARARELFQDAGT